MNKKLVWIAGILGSLALGGLIALAGSQNGALWMGLPLFALCCGVAFMVQWLLFIPAYLFQTERYFDLAGSLTYISLVLVALLLSGSADPRSFIIGGLVIICLLECEVANTSCSWHFIVAAEEGSHSGA